MAQEVIAVVETLVLGGTSLIALVAIFVVPPAYEKHLRERARQKNLTRLLAMHTRAPLIPVPSLDCLLAEARAQSKTAASPTPPDNGLAAVTPKHRRAD